MKVKIEITLILTVLFMILASTFAYMYKEEIYIFYRDNILKVRDNVNLDKNEYYKDENYLFVQNTDNFVVNNKQEIINAIYTIINSGQDKFTFFCDDDYFTCINDFKEIREDRVLLSNINNFVHPYNSFKEINTIYDDYGNLTIEVYKKYSEEDIKLINDKVNEIIKSDIKDNMSTKEKIKVIHNTIISNSKYATEDIQKENPDLDYSKAGGVLFSGLGICNSYADAMAIFLEKLDINNYKIASDSHVWNLVLVDEKWLHLDLTWDDPVTSDGSDKLQFLFFLINNERLNKLNVEMHDFDENVYIEATKN